MPRYCGISHFTTSIGVQQFLFFFCCRSSISSPSRSDDAPFTIRMRNSELFFMVVQCRDFSNCNILSEFAIKSPLDSTFFLLSCCWIVGITYPPTLTFNMFYFVALFFMLVCSLQPTPFSRRTIRFSLLRWGFLWMRFAINNVIKASQIKREKEQWMNGKAEVDSQRNHWNLIAFDIVECTCWCVFHPLHFTRSSSTRFVLENVCRCRPCSHMWPSSTAPARGWGGRMMVTFDLNLDLARFGWTIITCVKSHSQREEGFRGKNKSRNALGWLTFFRD